MNRSMLTIVGALLGVSFATTVLAERVEWKTEGGGNGHFYEAVAADDSISVDDAHAAAEEKGGHLATIGSEKENEFVFKLVDDEKFWGTDDYGNAFGPWIGGEQDSNAAAVGEGWSWVTGEEWDYTNWSAGAGEPNDSDNAEDHTEDFVTFFSFGSTDRVNEWNDSNASSPSVVGYVIEWTPKEELDAAKAKAAAKVKPAATTETGAATDSGSSQDSTESGDASGADTSTESSESGDGN